MENAAKEWIEYRIFDERMIYLDKRIHLNKKCTIKMKILNVEFPNFDFYKREHVIMIGLIFCDQNGNEKETVSINDRCAIYRNNSYLAMLSFKNAKIIRNGSELRMNVNNRQKNPFVEFAHLNKGKLYHRNKRKIRFKKLIQKFGSFVKIFIRQFYGKGKYSIHVGK